MEVFFSFLHCQIHSFYVKNLACVLAEPKIDHLAIPKQKNPARAEPKRAGSWLIPTLLKPAIYCEKVRR